MGSLVLGLLINIALGLPIPEPPAATGAAVAGGTAQTADGSRPTDRDVNSSSSDDGEERRGVELVPSNASHSDDESTSPPPEGWEMPGPLSNLDDPYWCYPNPAGDPISETVPLVNALNVEASTPITTTFCIDVVPATVEVGLAFRGSFTGTYPGTYSSSDSIEWVFDPDFDFKPGEVVVGTASGLIEKEVGTPSALDPPYTWQFTVAVDGGTGVFGDSGQSLGSSTSAFVSLGDLDGDGDIDAFVANFGAPNTVWLNDGSGILSYGGATTGNSNSNGAALGDVDDDGDLDAFVANWSEVNRVWLNDGAGGFTDSGQSLGSSNSGGVSLGDLDGDGDLDAFVANNVGNTVWLNDGTGVFSDSSQSLGTSYSWSAVLGDIDDDGDLDAFVGNFSSIPNKVWLNDGSAVFTDSGQSLGSSSSTGVALGDVNGDGYLDALAANLGGNSVWLNDTAGALIDSGQSLGSASSNGLALGDVDADGDLDVFVSNWSGAENRVWLNNGAGTFSDSGRSLGDYPGRHVASGDLDGDGDNDAFFGNDGGANFVWLNRDPIDLEMSQADLLDPVSVDCQIEYTVTVTNLDPDNAAYEVELVDTLPAASTYISAVPDQGSCSEAAGVVTCGLGTVGALGSVDVVINVRAPSVDGEVDNTATATSDVPDPDASNSVGVIETTTVELDPDGDCVPDSVDNCPADDNPGQADIDGDGVGDACDNCPLDPNPSQEDTEGDGFADACDNCPYVVNPGQEDLDGDDIGDACDICPAVAGSSPITATVPIPNALDVSASTDVGASFCADLDVSTVITTTFTVRGHYTGIYDGTFSSPPPDHEVVFDPSLDFKPGEVVMTTASRLMESSDGKSLYPPYTWQFTVAVDGGTGVFADSGQELGSSDSVDVSLGDIDGDGDLDAFVIDYGQPDVVWLNDGSGGFTDSGQALGNSSSRGVALGDVDGDGDLDAFVSNRNQPNRVWLNDGSGGFTDSGQALGSSYSWGVALGDVDGDSDLDAFVATSFSQVGPPANRVWLNDGSGGFTDSGQALGSSSSYGVALGDVDGDGDLDAFVGNSENQPNRVWLNDGLGEFTDSGQALGGSRSQGAALGDVDGDGDLDAFVGNAIGPNRVWLNDGLGGFTDSGQALGSGDSDGVALGDVDGDGDLDAFVSNDNVPMRVWLNDGAGGFTDSGQAFVSSRSQGAALGDVDGDGDLDAFVSNYASQPNRVWLNRDNEPVACFTVSPNPADEGEDVTLDASCSEQPHPDHAIVLWEWDLDDDGQFDDGTGEVLVYAFPDNGDWTVSLRVTDDNSPPEQDATSELVIVANVSPVVDAGPDQVVSVGETVAFSGSFADPGTGDSHTIAWDFGDGTPPVSGTLTPTHAYAANGTYTGHAHGHR